jgi:hypothetical protein
MPVAVESALTISVLFKFPNLEQNLPVSLPQSQLWASQPSRQSLKKPGRKKYQ